MPQAQPFSAQECKRRRHDPDDGGEEQAGNQPGQIGQPDGCPGDGLAAHLLDRVVQGHALDDGIVELDDQVAGLEPRAVGRRVLDRRDHLDEAVFHADLDAQTAELALRADLEFLERLLIEIRRMRIETGQHAVDRFGNELLILDGLDVIALDRAEQVVYDLLTAARAGNSELTAYMEECSIGNAIGNSCRMIQPAATEQGVKIIERCPSREMIVRADTTLLARVLDNLLFNALRHTPPGGEILIEAISREQMVEVIVTDSGPGLQEINPDDLFTIYKQADFRTRGLHRGVGIGFGNLVAERLA